jgi:pimeloyl-ACP methyl ester carboxylesterase
VILLHGFPEFWFGWRHQIDALANAGFRVLVPDQRGYNLSDKPKGIAAYDIDRLAADIIGLADAAGAKRFFLVGHDWGAIVAWWIAQHHPDRLIKLVAMDAPHPAVWRNAMENNPAQRRLSWYVRAFAVPFLPELMLRSRDYAGLADALKDSTRPLPDADLAAYRAAWAMPGALTSMINWYRAILRRRLVPPPPASIAVPAHVIWGAKDKYGLTALAEASAALCRDNALTILPDATHWVQHDVPERVNEILLDFLK